MKLPHSKIVLYGRSYDEVMDVICENGLLQCDPHPEPFLGLGFDHENSLLLFALGFRGEVEFDGDMAIVSPARINDVEDFIATMLAGHGIHRGHFTAVEFWGTDDEAVFDEVFGCS